MQLPFGLCEPYIFVSIRVINLKFSFLKTYTDAKFSKVKLIKYSEQSTKPSDHEV